MLRPLTRSSSGKFGRNTRHSKKSRYALKNKNHVATNHQGTSPIRKSRARKSIRELNLITSTPKIALSVLSSKGKRLSNNDNGAINIPKIPKGCPLSQSKSILETPNTPLSISKGITEIERSISTDFKRMTRSSSGSVDGANVIKNRSPKSRLAISPMPTSAKKHIECKKTVKETALNVTKRVTRSSIGNTIGASSMHGNVEKPVKFKNSNRKKSSIISKDSELLTTSNFRSVTDSTPLVKKIPKCKILVAPSPLSAQVGVRRKRTGKEAGITLEDSKRVEICSLNNALPSLQLAEMESEKKQSKTKNVSSASVNNRKAVQMKNVDSTSDTLMRNTRKSNSGSLPAEELPKRNCKTSTVCKRTKRKPTATPLIDKGRKNVALKKTDVEDSTPLDCLTMDLPNKRPRRHTVAVCVKSKRASNPSTIQQKTKKAFTSKKKTKSPDMSQFSIDCLGTFQPPTKSSKNRPKSAPAAIKRKSKAAGLQTPIPKKGTLKRQRWMFNALKEKNEGYEDDIFENQKFETPVFRMLNEADDESDTSISTPKFGFLLTPAPPKKTPIVKETISSSDLLLARKNAEEYLYRRNKKRTSGNSMLNSSSKISATCDEMPEKKKLEFAEAMDKVNTIRKEIEGKIQDESEEEDDYFTGAFS